MLGKNLFCLVLAIAAVSACGKKADKTPVNLMQEMRESIPSNAANLQFELKLEVKSEGKFPVQLVEQFRDYGFSTEYSTSITSAHPEMKWQIKASKQFDKIDPSADKIFQDIEKQAGENSWNLTWSVSRSYSERRAAKDEKLN